MDWKARVGATVLALAISLIIALVTGSLGLSGFVMSGSAILINAVRNWQERAASSQVSQGHAADQTDPPLAALLG
jgi:hypothetical protein